MISTQKTGAFISQLRKQQNMTQAEMAGKLMVSPQAVSKWETGQALPDAEQLLGISELFGVPINTILAGEEPQAAPATAASAAEAGAGASLHTTAAPAPAGGAPDQDAVVGLAPFVEQELLQEMVHRCGLYSFTLEQMEELAPFLGSDLLNRYAEQLGQVDARYLDGLAPFLRPAMLERLVDRLDARLTARQLAGLAPFLTGERLGELFRNRAEEPDGDLTVDDLVALAPFLPAHLLKAELETHPPRTLEELHEVAPFLDSSFVNRLARRLMLGGA